MKIMSFNLKDDGLIFWSNWKTRLKGFVELIKKEVPDIIGTQEMTPKARNLLKKLLIENKLYYNFYGESRKRNHGIFDEYNTILVKDNIKVISSFTYSLSDTPKTPNTKFKNDPFPRIITYIETENFYIYNTHLTNKITENKFLQLDIISKLIKKDKPIIITGDFNMGMAKIKNFYETNKLIDTTKNLGKTFSTEKELYHLDHILISDYLKYKNPKKHNYKYKHIHISDHYPISVEIDI